MALCASACNPSPADQREYKKELDLEPFPFNPRPAWLDIDLPPHLLASPQVLETLKSIDAHRNLSWRLGRQKTSGGVLRHAIGCFESLHSRFYPMIFKFGMTQNAANRWDNKDFGYRLEKDKWDSMVILFLCPEKFSPAFLEAALIEKYRGFLDIT